jgi:hypothetical protein
MDAGGNNGKGGERTQEGDYNPFTLLAKGGMRFYKIKHPFFILGRYTP